MRRYLLLLAHEPGGWEAVSAEERLRHADAHAAFDRFVDGHGRRVSGAPLTDPDTATTVRHLDGRRVLSDGPFARTVEAVGGYYDVELPDLDVAIEAASLLPRTYAVEIRSVVELAPAPGQAG